MAQLYPIAGSKLFIGSRVMAKGTVTAADFANATWTEIGGWANAGAYGDTQEMIEQSLINENRVRKAKGTRNGGMMENQFVPMGNDPGQILFKQAIDDCVPYQFKIEYGADCLPSFDVTISVASPGVVTWQNHGFQGGQPVIFSSTGALPTGLTAGTVYYVRSDGLTENTFTVATTVGGAGVATTVAGTGVQTASAPPVGMTDLFYGFALPGARSGGEANSPNLRTWSIALDSNVVEI